MLQYAPGLHTWILLVMVIVPIGFGAYYIQEAFPERKNMGWGIFWIALAVCIAIRMK